MFSDPGAVRFGTFRFDHLLHVLREMQETIHVHDQLTVTDTRHYRQLARTCGVRVDCATTYKKWLDKRCNYIFESCVFPSFVYLLVLRLANCLARGF